MNRGSIPRAIAVAVAVLLTAGPAKATVVSSSGTVVLIYSYATFGGGDVVVRLSSQPATCAHGFWLSPSQPGFKNNLAYLLAAKAAGESILIGGEDTTLWTGSSGTYCKVDYVGMH